MKLVGCNVLAFVFGVLAGGGFVQIDARAQPVFQGKVLDPAQGAIAGAEVTLGRLESRSAEQTTISDQNGRFSFVVLPGRYIVHIHAKGFLQITEDLNLETTAAQSRDFVMQLSPVVATVTVTEAQRLNDVAAISTATRTLTPLRDIPQSITVVTQNQIREQASLNIGDVVRYIPGITAHQGENNRDQIIIRGANSSADFFVNGVRDDAQYYRDLYNVERIEALKGPNAMVFGRGGGGGVINRVTKDAGFMPVREITLLGGSFQSRRFTTDVGGALTDQVAVRLNGVYENSDSFRRFVDLSRYGVAPALTILAGRNTRMTFGYERFRDRRIADRGIPSFQGRPVDTDVSAYFGNPNDSHVRADLNLGTAAIEHQAGRFSFQNRTSVGDYDRAYQNYVPGVVSAGRTDVAISAYNNATRRRNAFNQANVTYGMSTGVIRHTFVAGAEIGRQWTDNLRNTGYFGNIATSIAVLYSDPIIHTSVTYRQSATDANNHLETNLAATYIQDQIELSRHVRIITGLRFDYFDLQYHNNRTNEELRRIDHLVSPRAGIVLKPAATVSVYGNYSVSHLPSSGDQFSSLTTVTQQVKPEKFNNYEAGLKWDVYRDFSFTTALYRLDRTNTRSTDPNDSTRIVQTGKTRTNGYELGLSGRVVQSWRIYGGYSWQDAFIASATSNARAGARVAQVPHHMFSMWNNWQITRRVATGLGILHRSDMYAAVDNTVTLPGYTRADAAMYYSVTERVRLQANVENVFNTRYYINADGNTNISPGSSRAVRVALTTRF